MQVLAAVGVAAYLIALYALLYETVKRNAWVRRRPGWQAHVMAATVVVLLPWIGLWAMVDRLH